MINLADEIIKQQERKGGASSSAPDGYIEDDMGYWVEENLYEDRARYAKYLLMRILKKNNNLYLRHGRLYSGHKLLSGNSQEILQLVDLPYAHVGSAQVAWIYNRLLETVPELDESKIMVGKNAFWDFEKAEVIELEKDANVITAKDKNVRARF